MKACMFTYGNREGQRSDTIELNDLKLHLKQILGPETPKVGP